MYIVRRRRQRGVAAVEFALLLIPMVLMVFGITEFGRAFYQYDTLVKSVRSAARYLTTQNSGAGWSEARCLAVYGNAQCAGGALLPGLTTAMVSICDASNCPATHRAVATGEGAVNLVTVTIGGATTPYSFTSAVPFVVPSLEFGAVSTTMRQVL